MGFGKKKLSKLAWKLRIKFRRKDRDMLDPKKAVDVTYTLDDSHHDHPMEEIELEPHQINIGASLLDVELDPTEDRKLNPVSQSMLPASAKRSERRSIKFGFSENIDDGKSGFSMRVILMGAAAAPAQRDQYNMTESDADLIGTVVGGADYEEESVNSNVSNISGTTNVLPPVAPIDGRLFDIMDLERADDSYYFKRMNSWEVAVNSYEDGEDSQRSYEVSTLADGELTDMEKADMMKENCAYCIAPSAAVMTTTTCAAAAAMALL